MCHEQPHRKRAVLREAAFLKIHCKSAWRDHRLIVLTADGHRHACITQDFNECLGGSGLERVHSPRMVSIRSKAIRFHSENFEFAGCQEFAYGGRLLVQSLSRTGGGEMAGLLRNLQAHETFGLVMHGLYIPDGDHPVFTLVGL